MGGSKTAIFTQVVHFYSGGVGHITIGGNNNAIGYRDPYGIRPVSEANNVGYYESKRVSPTLRLEWHRGSTTFTSLTNYTDFSFSYREDCDGSAIDYCQGYLGQTLKQWSQELRATHQAGDSTWTIGAYYLNINNDKLPQGFLFPGLSGTDFAYDDVNVFSQTTRSYALFSQLEWKLAEKWRLTAGARYTHDQKTFDSKVYFNELGNGYSGGTGSTVFTPPLLVYDFSPEAVGNLARQKANLWTGKLQVDYLPRDGALLYAGISRGVKGGGFNTNIAANLTPAETPFKPETVYAYEVGEKFDLLDRRLRVNSSAFYYDYRGFQGYAFNGLQGVVGNYDGTFYGAELEVNASLPRRIQLRIGASYIHSKLQDIPTAYSGVRDEQSLLAPHWVTNGSVEKSIQLGKGELGLQWSFDYEGDRYASVDNNPAVFVKGSFEHHARINYEFDGLELAAYVNNIGDTHRRTFAYDLISAGGYRGFSLAPPRWWGLSIRKKF